MNFGLERKQREVLHFKLWVSKLPRIGVCFFFFFFPGKWDHLQWKWVSFILFSFGFGLVFLLSRNQMAMKSRGVPSYLIPLCLSLQLSNAPLQLGELGVLWGTQRALWVPTPELL